MRILLFVYFILSSSVVWAFQVKPMVAELQPSGSQSQKTIRILNTTSSPLTIETSAFSLKINEEGKEQLTASDNDFLIIPMTAIIPAGKSQSVIVRYIGEPLLESSKAYRIFIDQVAVNLDANMQSGMGMSFSFRTLFNVVPKNAEAKVVVISKQQITPDMWQVLFENKGNKYARVSKAQWKINNGEQKLQLEGQELSKALTDTIVLPHSKRNLLIKIPPQFNADKSELEVLF